MVATGVRRATAGVLGRARATVVGVAAVLRATTWGVTRAVALMVAEVTGVAARVRLSTIAARRLAIE